MKTSTDADQTGRTIPTTEDFAAALKVLEYLEKHQSVTRLTRSSPLSDIYAAVQTQLSIGPELRSAYRTGSGPPKRRRGKCYICHYVLKDPHDLYPSLCKPCGSFNIAESNLSLPHNLRLSGKTAVVTGGRVNLGFHTTLRLLRCGAKVIVSTRYPWDAQKRYTAEEDSDEWKDRLKIIGADFRTAKDVFSLLSAIQEVLLAAGFFRAEESASGYFN
jgi:hypothetical protein